VKYRTIVADPPWPGVKNEAVAVSTARILEGDCLDGTTGVVALRHDRDYIGVELNPTYAQMARDRIYDDGPLLNTMLGEPAR
jgi:hypothetical protein